MKKDYLKPEVEVIAVEVNTVMMAESADTGMGDTPSTPDARGRRGKWGNLWSTEDRPL